MYELFAKSPFKAFINLTPSILEANYSLTGNWFQSLIHRQTRRLPMRPAGRAPLKGGLNRTLGGQGGE